MKKLIFVCLFSCVFLSAAGASTFFPMDAGRKWVYTGYKKDNPKKSLSIAAVISGKEIMNGVEYYNFSAPAMDIRFLVREGADGIYMKVMRYPFPVFSFLSTDIVMNPDVMFIKNRMMPGEEWGQEITADAMVLGIFRITKKVLMRFKVIGVEDRSYNGSAVKAYHIEFFRDEGDGKKIIENHWYVQGAGYVEGETREHYIKLNGLSARP